MRRIVMILTVAGLFLAACGGATDSTTPNEAVSDSAPSASDSATTTSQESIADPAEGPSTTSAPNDLPPATAAVTDFDGPAAEDFTVDLNKNGAFTLSEEARPVYMVFWAEW